MANDLAHQFGTLLAFLISCVCLAYIAQRGWAVLHRGRQFSLRDFIIVGTLVIALLRLIIGLATQDPEGVLRFRMWKEFDRHSDQP